MNMTNSIPSKAEVYMRTLSTLEDDVKIELINLLSSSLISKRHSSVAENKPIDLNSCFHGNWGEGMSTEEYCKMLRSEGVNTLTTE